MKHQENGSATDAASSSMTSRRTEPRFQPPAQLRCVIAGTAATLIIQDISVGGVALLSTLPISRTAIHQVKLTLGHVTIARRARAVHCQRSADQRWKIGLAFVEERTTGPTIEQLIDLITRSLIKFS